MDAALGSVLSMVDPSRPDDAVPDSPDSPDAAERRSRLLGVKLAGLVGDHLALDDEARAGLRAGSFPRGAAVVVDAAAWVLVDGDARRVLGGALAWALRQGASSLAVIADSHTGLLARRAAMFDFPIDVWYPEGRALLPAVAEPLPSAPDPDATHLALVEVIERAGATPSIEHGVVTGEVRGLEVCRVVDQPTVGLFAELGDVGPLDALAEPPTRPSGVQLEVGVGANDREAFQLLHGDIPTVEALATVVDSIVDVRSGDAPQHPLNRLAQERYLRWRLEQEPALVDAVAVAPAPSPIPRTSLSDVVPCVATAVDSAGAEHAIVCSVGVDLELVPFVADVQAAFEAPVRIVVPSRDLVPITADLAALLHTPVELLAVD